MSSALCVFIHASETGHAEGVPIAPSRGRSVEFPSKGNYSSLSVGHYELCRDDIGDLPGSHKHL